MEGLAKVGVPKEVLEFLFGWVEGGGVYAKIPEAKGSIKAVRSVAFFIPLYELYLTYGGIFRLTFGPKVSYVFLFLFPFFFFHLKCGLFFFGNKASSGIAGF